MSIKKFKMFSLFFALLLTSYYVSDTSAQSCGTSYLTAVTGYPKFLSSPNYPYNYPPSTTCQWTITAPTSYVVEITFTAFETESLSGTCSSSSDTLHVYDGILAYTGTVIGKYCGKYLPPKLYSSSRYMLLEFRTDSSDNRKGFQLKYQAVLKTSICGTSSLNAATGYPVLLSSPNYPSNYPKSTTCQWTITAPTGYVVEITFTAFETQSYIFSETCSSSSDTLEVYDGNYASISKLRGKYCGKYLPPKVYSSSTYMLLKFRTDSFNNRKGFQLKYQAVRQKKDYTICSPFNSDYQNNHIKYTGSSGYIESPLYGSKYPSNMQCTWVITVPQGKTIKLTFSDFNVGGTYSFCTGSSTNDHLELRNGQYSFSTTLKTLCGKKLPSQVRSTQRYMWIRFKSNSVNEVSSSTTGFKARYEAVSFESSNATGIIVGVITAVVAVIVLVIICVCISNRKRTPGHVNVQTPAGAQTTVQSTQNTTGYAPQYPQQLQAGFIPPPPIGYYPAPQGSYPPPPQGSYPPPPPQGGYQQPPPGIVNPGYPPQSSVPMMPYPSQAVPNDPPPAYPGPASYPPQAATAQVQLPGAPANPNPPYPPPQGTQNQQSSPPYPPTQDTKHPTAPSF